jgi:hypothetical protein
MVVVVLEIRFHPPLSLQPGMWGRDPFSLTRTASKGGGEGKELACDQSEVILTRRKLAAVPSSPPLSPATAEQQRTPLSHERGEGEAEDTRKIVEAPPPL